MSLSRVMRSMNSRSTPRLKRILLAALPGGVFVAGLSSAAGASGPSEISSGLVITKSSNRNEVHYAVQVDDACTPAGRSPIRPYWRMRERGADATEPLVESELRAFGVERQEVVPGGVNVVLRGMPARAITIRTFRGPGGACTSSVSMTISGVPAHVSDVYVRQKLFGVDYVQLTGRTSGGDLVRERISL
jgi:Domain of unknown function (DUF4833)